MPRSGWIKPETDQRLSDHISIGVVTRVFPPELVDRVVIEAGRVEQRHRLLPARVVVYYVLAMALFSGSSYEEVMRALVEGLAWESGWRQVWEIPAKGSIFKARSRLGREPMRLLFEAVAAPMADARTAGAFYRDLRLISLDGTCLDVADTPANEREFGRPGTGRGEGVGAFPQLRLVALSETGTHAICAAAMGPLSRSENALADELLGGLQAGMLCLADRGFYSFQRWQNARQTRAQLLWRVKSNMVLPREQQLSDGSYLTRIYANQPDQRAHRNGHQVRVVEYQIDDGVRSDPEQRYRLLSTILDPDQAPAAELGRIYHERWELESTLDELKVHQRGPRVVLRSKAPDGVYQEAYGYLCTHYAIRRLMQDASLRGDLDPDRLSFTQSLRAARRSARTQPGFSPLDDQQRA